MRLRRRTVIARRLHRKATEVEQLFWRGLGTSGLPSKFRRQHAIGRHFVRTSSRSSWMADSMLWRLRPTLTVQPRWTPPAIGCSAFGITRCSRRCARRSTLGAGVPHLTPTLSAPGGGKEIDRCHAAAECEKSELTAHGRVMPEPATSLPGAHCRHVNRSGVCRRWRVGAYPATGPRRHDSSCRYCGWSGRRIACTARPVPEFPGNCSDIRAVAW
jgi:Protein of unknown function (DUF559)